MKKLLSILSAAVVLSSLALTPAFAMDKNKDMQGSGMKQDAGMSKDGGTMKDDGKKSGMGGTMKDDGMKKDNGMGKM